MLRVTIPETEFYDEKKDEFITTKEQTLALEHSLVSISKWESIFHKSFMSSRDKTEDEVIEYIRCMTITQNVDPKIYRALPNKVIKEIQDYIQNPMSAQKFYDEKKTPSNEIITSELIYYWMIAYQIPFECEKWHIQRLMNLIKICSIKNAPPKKMSKNELMSRYASVNAMRRKSLGTSG